MFEEYYKSQLEEILDISLEPEHGLSNDEIKSKLIKAGLVTLAQALFEYYLLAGNLGLIYGDVVLPIDSPGWEGASSFGRNTKTGCSRRVTNF